MICLKAPLRCAFIFVITAMMIVPIMGQKNSLSREEINFLNDEIADIAEKDQLYRTPLFYGTTNDSILNHLEYLSKTLEIEDYLKATKDFKFKLPKAVEDSLWNLQRGLDLDNYHRFVKLVKMYGYPSAERLGKKADNIFPLLLHPPFDIDEINAYTRRMQKLLLPEVKKGNMPAKLYASFYDNMQAKILRKPQLYGTNYAFDTKTSSVLPPGITNIKKTNKARKAIGLPLLKEGEYRIIE